MSETVSTFSKFKVDRYRKLLVTCYLSIVKTIYYPHLSRSQSQDRQHRFLNMPRRTKTPKRKLPLNPERLVASGVDKDGSRSVDTLHSCYVPYSFALGIFGPYNWYSYRPFDPQDWVLFSVMLGILFFFKSILFGGFWWFIFDYIDTQYGDQKIWILPVFIYCINQLTSISSIGINIIKWKVTCRRASRSCGQHVFGRWGVSMLWFPIIFALRVLLFCLILCLLSYPFKQERHLKGVEIKSTYNLDAIASLFIYVSSNVIDIIISQAFILTLSLLYSYWYCFIIPLRRNSWGRFTTKNITTGKYIAVCYDYGQVIRCLVKVGKVPEWIQWSTKKKMFVGTHKKLGNVERQLLEVDDISLTKDHFKSKKEADLYIAELFSNVSATGRDYLYVGVNRDELSFKDACKAQEDLYLKKGIFSWFSPYSRRPNGFLTNGLLKDFSTIELVRADAEEEELDEHDQLDELHQGLFQEECNIFGRFQK